jgi:hypothetical protein
MSVEHQGKDNRENTQYLERNPTKCHFATTNPSRTETGLNVEFCGERLPTNGPSHGPANPVSSNIN